MIIFSFGSERKLFQEGPVRDRLSSLGAYCEEYHIIVFTLRSQGYTPTKAGNNVYIYPTNSINKALYFFDALRVFLKKTSTYNQEKRAVSVITSQDSFETGLVALVCARIRQMKLHIQVHTNFFAPHFATSFVQKLRILIAPFVLKRAHSIRVVSDTIKQHIIKRHTTNAPIEVLPVYIDTSRFYPSAPISDDAHSFFDTKGFVVLMASRLEPEKNIPTAIDAVARLSKRIPHIQLLIVGAGSLESKLNAQIKKCDAGAYIKLLPWTNELPSLYRSADLFLLASFFEGYNMTIIESLLCGTPVLCAKDAAPDGVINDGVNSWIYESSLEEALTRVISQKDMYSEITSYLAEHPYVYAYQDKEKYDMCFIESVRKALNH